MANEEAIAQILDSLEKNHILNEIAVIDEAFVRLIINAYESYPNKELDNG